MKESSLTASRGMEVTTHQAGKGKTLSITSRASSGKQSKKQRTRKLTLLIKILGKMLTSPQGKPNKLDLWKVKLKQAKVLAKTVPMAENKHNYYELLSHPPPGLSPALLTNAKKGIVQHQKL